MNRREALKAALAISINGMPAMKAFPVPATSKLIIFYNPNLFGLKEVNKFLSDYPGSTAYPVEGSLDDAIRIVR